MRIRYIAYIVLSVMILFAVGCRRQSTNPPPPSNTPYHIVLTGATQHTAVPGTPLAYQAIVMLPNGNYLLDSVLVWWRVRGRGAWNTTSSYTTNGIATNMYSLGAGVGVDTLTVATMSGSDTVRGTLVLALTAGAPSRVHFLQANQFEFLANSPAESIGVVVYDTVFNPIHYPQLNWNCNLGMIVGAGTSSTGDTAYALFSISNRAGYGRLWVTTTGCLSDTLSYHAYSNMMPVLSIIGPSSHVAYPNDTIAFSATPTLSGNLYADSMYYHWSSKDSSGHASIGHWLRPDGWSATGNMVNYYVMGTGTGIDTLMVTGYVAALQDSVRARAGFAHVPGPARNSTLLPSTGAVYPNSIIHPTAVFRDSVGNIVPRVPVTWGCTTGMASITSDGYSSNGDTAIATMTVGTTYGNFRFWVTTSNMLTDTAHVTVQRAIPGTLTFYADTSSLQVCRTLGNDSTKLHANVGDGNGNPIGAGTRVLFQLLNSSQFVDTTNGSPYFNGIVSDTITATTNTSGEATVTLFSSTHTGTALLRAFVLDSNSHQTTIQETLSNIVIHAGPPNRMSLSYYNVGTQAGNSQWLIYFNSTLRDRYGNPVGNGDSITFSVGPAGTAQLDQTSTYTGNVGPSGQHLPGVAFTQLRYPSANTFDSVMVYSWCIGLDSSNAHILLLDSIYIALPLQQGAMQLHVQPMTFTFTRMPRVDAVAHTVYATVTDGYGTLIHGCPVNFSVQRGRIFKTEQEAQTRVYSPALVNNSQPIPGTNPPIYEYVNVRKTGNYTVSWYPALGWTDPNGNGSATVWIGALGPSLATVPPIGDIFLSPSEMTATSVVTAMVQGHPDIQQVSVTINYSRN